MNLTDKPKAYADKPDFAGSKLVAAVDKILSALINLPPLTIQLSAVPTARLFRGRQRPFRQEDIRWPPPVSWLSGNVGYFHRQL